MSSQNNPRRIRENNIKHQLEAARIHQLNDLRSRQAQIDNLAQKEEMEYEEPVDDRINNSVTAEMQEQRATYEQQSIQYQAAQQQTSQQQAMAIVRQRMAILKQKAMMAAQQAAQMAAQMAVKAVSQAVLAVIGTAGGSSLSVIGVVLLISVVIGIIVAVYKLVVCENATLC